MSPAKKLPFFFDILTLVSQTPIKSRKLRPPSGGGILEMILNSKY